MPRLRAVAGPSQDKLMPISVNSDVPHNIVSDAFEGQILAYVKGFMDEEGNVLQNEYFHREDRKGITWSIQVQGSQPQQLDFLSIPSPNPCGACHADVRRCVRLQDASFVPSLRMMCSSETRSTVP
jgi:hypothetical protein